MRGRFQTYFPHVDNVYSHRSTQRYKRKPFVSHYWDCRLKGRPPGTPKSDDPNKKKRKRTARQRDLCDVKIKITEYFSGFAPELAQNESEPAFSSELLPGVNTVFEHQPGDGSPSGRDAQPFGVLTPNPALPEGHPGVSGERFFTIQRVNGNGANGRNEGVGGGHRHTLEDSDRVKKNSVQRHMLNEARDRKKPSQVRTFLHSFCLPFPTAPMESRPYFCRFVQSFIQTTAHLHNKNNYSHFVYIVHFHNQASKWRGRAHLRHFNSPLHFLTLTLFLSLFSAFFSFFFNSILFKSVYFVSVILTQPVRKTKTMPAQHQTGQKTYHTKATGTAASTAVNHKGDSDLKLFGSCFW